MVDGDEEETDEGVKTVFEEVVDSGVLFSVMPSVTGVEDRDVDGLVKPSLSVTVDEAASVVDERAVVPSEFGKDV